MTRQEFRNALASESAASREAARRHEMELQAAEAARRGLADELARVRERCAALEAEAEDVKALALLADQARTLHLIES